VRQNKRVDGLVFSGKDHLPTLEEEFDRVEMWEKFMKVVLMLFQCLYTSTGRSVHISFIDLFFIG
jgi:hypothetical protein